jgi:hypothetical protein
MNGIVSRNVRFGFGLLALVTLGWVLAGQAAKPVNVARSVPTDWSHGHLIFSHPATPEVAGRVANDPRYWQQLDRGRMRTMMMPAGLMERAASGSSAAGSVPRRISGRRRMHGDWSVNLGSTGSVGASTFPAKYAFHSNVASCSDFVVFSTGLQGSATQASIAAFNNLYSGGCSGTVPSVLWAYLTAPVPARILTSPALSRDGSQLAFVQTDGPDAQLVLLKWAANSSESVTSPGTPTIVSLANYRACTAPCMTTFNLTDATGLIHNDDRKSSVFINYSGDTAWVGDSGGLLHQFTGVFLGTPAEVVNGIFPVQVSSIGDLGSPVFDSGSQQVFAAGVVDGVLYRVDPVTGTKIASGPLDASGNLVAGPIVDSSLGTVYVSASNDGTTNCPGPAACSGVYQLTTTFGAGTTGNEVAVGTSSATPNPMYHGFFDSAYLKSVNGTGNFYICGNTGGHPTVYQVPINADVFGTPTTVSVLTRTQNQPCSPLIDVNNPNTSGGASERVFVSTALNAWPNICQGGGCVISFVVTQWQPSTAYNVGQEILVASPDNPNVLYTYVVTDPGTSGTTPPHWLATPDLEVSDPNNAGVFWLNQGRIDDTPYHDWVANNSFNVVGQRIIDSNGNAQMVHHAGTSGATPPVFATVPGNTTNEGPDTLQWRCAGPVPTAALPAAGGTSGIIIDNVVGTLAGASQVYFSTLKDELCGDGTTGSCAVQASQVGLQ